MKVQSLAVIFAIIILPIIIILSYYIHLSIDTIAIQNSYDTKLLDSTHDALVSFELNTANENLSSVSDALRSIIEASTNVFFNTLSTNLGMSNASKSYIQNYVPAILYTLYDGYYIYSPTRVPTVLTGGDEQVIYVGDRGLTNAGEFVETSTGKTIGKYEFKESEYEKDLDVTTKESEDIKSLRQSNLYNSLPTDRKYEYGQMLYKNEDGTYSTEISENTVYNQDYVLKSYMPYSARYINQDKDYDLTINYTLDNYLTIEGYIGKIYYSKTGYLIAKDVVQCIELDGVEKDLLSYNEDTAEEICLSGEHRLNLKIQPILEDGVTRTATEIELTYEPWEEDGIYLNDTQIQEKLNKLYEELRETENKLTKAGITEDEENELRNQIEEKRNRIQDLESRLANLNAITYYVKSQIFSNWVYDNLGEGALAIKANNIASDIAELNSGIYTTTNNLDLFHNFEDDESLIFDVTINPEKEDSPFYSHKVDVIRNAIQYNLNLALSSYNEMAVGMNIQMPVISDSEWEKILNNVSIVSFMQGFKCGMKTYNNYAIVSSTNNELTVIPNEIYYTKKNEFNTSDTSHLYHRIDCEALEDDEYISFTSKEIKYDKIYDKASQVYKYDHRNNGCYSCIISSNYLKTVNYDAGGNPIKGYSNDVLISTLSPIKQKEYYKAVGKERQKLYKTNALTSSNGYEVLFTSTSNTSNSIEFGEGSVAEPDDTLHIVEIPSITPSSKGLDKIKEIELVIRDVQSGNRNNATASFQAKLNAGDYIANNFVVNLEQTSPQTITIPVHSEDTNKLTKITLMKTSPEDDIVKCNILSVRVIYE